LTYWRRRRRWWRLFASLAPAINDRTFNLLVEEAEEVAVHVLSTHYQIVEERHHLQAEEAVAVHIVSTRYREQREFAYRWRRRWRRRRRLFTLLASAFL
jgi:hypothetical protein